MHASLNLDDLRNTFRAAFEEYTTEGRRMAELLVNLEASTSSTEIHEINRQQERLTEAQSRYEEARQRYVSFVLAGFTAPGDPAFVVH